MASKKYAEALPAIKTWISRFGTLEEVTGDDFNVLFIDKLGWEQNADEAKNKKNLIVWIRKTFPEKDVRGLGVTKLIKDSMCSRRPSLATPEADASAPLGYVRAATVDPSSPAANLSVAAYTRTSSLPPPPRPSSAASNAIDNGRGASVQAPRQLKKLPFPPTLVNPVFPKVHSTRTSAKAPQSSPSADVQSPQPTTTAQAPPLVGAKKYASIPKIASKSPITPPPTSIATPLFSSDRGAITPAVDVIIHLDQDRFHDMLTDAHVALRMGDYDAVIAQLSSAVAFAVMAKEKERQIQMELANSEQAVVKSEHVDGAVPMDTDEVVVPGEMVRSEGGGDQVKGGDHAKVEHHLKEQVAGGKEAQQRRYSADSKDKDSLFVSADEEEEPDEPEDDEDSEYEDL